MNTDITNIDTIQNKIYNIRDMQMMLDSDLAELYGVETKRINEVVKRNPDKFPDDLMFEMTQKEVEILRSQNATFKESLNNRKYLPKVFTEQGVYMLATVLKSKIATEVTLSIMRTFTKMKHFLSQNQYLFQKIDQIEKRQLKLDLEKYNSQYTQIEIKKFDISHDRFLIIDENEVYHIGASLKDLGKKWFAFSKMDIDNFEMFKRLK